jgi:putative ABC transport system permease protein
MIRNYFKTAWRNLFRDRFYSLINISGLAIGLAVFMLIALYVIYELSFDRYHVNAGRIFRIVENLRTENELLLQSTSSPPMGPALQRDFPEVKSYVRFAGFDGVIRIGEDSFHEQNCYLADSTVFEIFSWLLLKGNPQTALTEPNTAVLTASTAKRLFGDQDPVGETINFIGEEIKITGVMENLPENSHFPVNILISFSSWSSRNQRVEREGWFNNGFHTYLLLEEGEDMAGKLRAKMPDLLIAILKRVICAMKSCLSSR